MLAAERPRALSLLPLARLLRLHNGAIAALGVLVGGWWARGAAAWNERVFVVAVVAVALAGFANAVNDCYDVEIDRVAHPDRPLPSGSLSPSVAVAAAIVAGLLALALATLVAVPLAMLTVGVLVAMVAYSAALSRLVLVGNVVVATLASLPFFYGAWAAGDPRAGLPLVAVALPLHLAREIAKDIDDSRGDAASRATLPIRFGAPAARWAAVAATAIFGVAVAMLAGDHTRLWIALLPALACALGAAALLIRARAGAPALYKAAMVCAMAALFV